MEKGKPKTIGAPLGASKPGGGGKMQAYIPKGNGGRSGQYASANRTLHYTRPGRKKLEYKRHSADWPNCGGKRIINVKGAYNFAKAKVKTVTAVIESNYHDSLPAQCKPNSVIKKIVAGCVVTERYYDERGEACLGIDYSNHGNRAAHPKVPHFHSLKVSSYGQLIRNHWEDE